jgi:hypothetical protein
MAGSRDGYSSYCKRCQKAYKKKFRDKHMESERLNAELKMLSDNAMISTEPKLSEEALKILEKRAPFILPKPVSVVPNGPPVRVLYPFGFIEDRTRRRRSWNAGEIIINEYEIALLKEHGCQLEDVDESELAE